MTFSSDIRADQREALVEPALACDVAMEDDCSSWEGRFADVIADLAAARPVTNRDLLVRFLWQRVSLRPSEAITLIPI